MKLTAPQLRLLNRLSSETVTLIHKHEARTVMVLGRLGLIEPGTIELKSLYGHVATGYKLTYRGLCAVLDNTKY
jgi:hypothetical protein